MDKRELLKSRLNTAEIDVPGVGTIQVRGLSRSEVLDLGNVDGVLLVERKTLFYGLVDPKLTEDEVAEWQSLTTGSELNPIVETIIELSGLGSGAVKTAYKSTDE